MQKDRPAFASDEIDEGTPVEVKEAFESFDAYSGKYSVDFVANTVTHHVDMARSPTRVGSDLLRHYKIEDGNLRI